MAAAFFRAANVITSNGNVNSSDVVKTLVVSNGNKALTNDPPAASTNPLKSNGDKSDIVPSGSSEVCNSNDVVSKTEVEYEKKVSSSEAHLTQPVRGGIGNFPFGGRFGIYIMGIFRSAQRRS